jgi:hypothetical protein
MVISTLVWLAALGYTFALILLAILGTMLLVGLGEIFSLIRDKIAAQRQQQQFLDNAHENLTIMNSLQGIQNKQNQILMRQLGQLSKLPPLPPQPNFNGDFLIEDGVFDELEE